MDKLEEPLTLQKTARESGGFTILEVMVAAIVMVLAITTSITAMQSGYSALSTSRNSTLASQIMQSEIERIRLMPWDLPGGAVDSIQELPASDPVPLATMFSANPALAARFTVTRTVTADGSGPPT